MPSNGDHEGLPPDLAARLAEEDAKADLEMDRILALSDEEVMKELEAEGMTREQVEADAVAMAERIPALAAKLVAEEEARERDAKRATVKVAALPAGKTVAQAPPARPSLLARSFGKELAEVYASWLAVAAAGVAIVGAWGAREWSLAHHPPDVSAVDGGEELTHDQIAARRLRAEAAAACDAKQWAACKADLDDAKALDPAGEDRDPAIGELRAKVVAMLKAAGEGEGAGEEKGGKGTREGDTDESKGPGTKGPHRP